MGIELVRERLTRAADALSDLDVSELDADELRVALDGTRIVGSQVSRLQLALTARADDLHQSGCGDDPVDLLTGVGAMPRRAATRVLGHAELLGRMPQLAGALRAGRISEGHVDAVATARRRFDATLKARFDAEDGFITRYAIRFAPDPFAEHLRSLVRRLERARGRDLDVQRRRASRLSKRVDQATGMYELRGSFDPELGTRIFTALDTAIETLRKYPGSVVPGEDPRDSLGSDREFLGAHALGRLVSHGHAIEHPGLTEVMVICDERTLTHGEHDHTVCEYADGTPADPDLARRLCCEAMLTAVVVTADGRVPLNVGRTIRTANREQRRALRAVHRTCAFEGCFVPFEWCEIHHIWFWERGGPTDITNLVPLCLRHHHLIHNRGWTLTLNSVDRTLTVYRPDGSIYSEARPPGLRPPPVEPDQPPERSPCTTAA